MNWSLNNKKNQVKHYNNPSRNLTIKISESGLLLALAVATSLLCIEIMPKIDGFLQFDCGIFLLIIALYLVKYWFTFAIAIIHGFSTTFISGSWVGGLSNAIIGVSVITIWFLLTILFFNKEQKLNKNPKHQWLILLIIIIITIASVSIIGVLSNKYFLLNLYGYNDFVTNSHYLWVVLLPFNITNLLINILIFIIIMPTFSKMIKFKK